jgi:hypothetical protein
MPSQQHYYFALAAIHLFACASAGPSADPEEHTAERSQELHDWAAARQLLNDKYNSLPPEVLDALGNSLGGVHQCDWWSDQRSDCAYLEFEGGRIYMNQDYQQGAYVMYGDIYQTWLNSGRERYLGTPITDETGTPDGRGRFNHFSLVSIYWTPEYGAHVVWPDVRYGWSKTGWEQGPWGYPTAEQYDNEWNNGRCGPNPLAYPLKTQDFEYGFACADIDRQWFVPW